MDDVYDKDDCLNRSFYELEDDNDDCLNQSFYEREKEDIRFDSLSYKTNKTDPEDMDYYGQINLTKLKSLREQLNWENEEERYQFYLHVTELMLDWKGNLPNLRDIFRDEEIDYFLSEAAMNRKRTRGNYRGGFFVKFVVRTGYKDKPELNEDGKPSLRRTTAVHRVEDTENSEVILFHLFEIYNRFDVNYTDESGYTHFHAACKSRNYHAIEKFLELGQDPNCIVPETGDSPLHLIIAKDHGFDRAIQLLIRSGADPTLPNKEGLTPLHVICKLIYYESVAKTFLEICDDVQLIVQVDARDELGRTPLQLAVANLSPGTVDVLLDRGADLSSFVFPTEDYFGKERKPDDYSRLPNWYFFLVSSAMIVVERLEKRGYELERSGALTIMKFFIKHAFFKNSEDFKKCLNSDKIFACAAKETMFVPGLSFYDFIQLPCEKAEKLLTHENLFKLDITEDFLYERITVHRPCVAQLCEMRTRRFLRRWALEPLLELTRHYRLPIPCCEVMIEKLSNKDLMNICFAVAD